MYLAEKSGRNQAKPRQAETAPKIEMWRWKDGFYGKDGWEQNPTPLGYPQSFLVLICILSAMIPIIPVKRFTG
jgi:hypothetical protein